MMVDFDFYHVLYSYTLNMGEVITLQEKKLNE